MCVHVRVCLTMGVAVCDNTSVQNERAGVTVRRARCVGQGIVTHNIRYITC